MIKRNFIASIMCVSTLILASPSAFSDEFYLKALEAEAEGLNLDNRGWMNGGMSQKKANNEKRWSLKNQQLSEQLPSGLMEKEFLDVLQSSFIGTYVLYKQLDEDDKKTVYHRYTKSDSASVESVRKSVANLLKH